MCDDDSSHDHRPVLRYKALKKFIKAHVKHHHQDHKEGGAEGAAGGSSEAGGGVQAGEQQPQQQSKEAGAGATGAVPAIAPDQLSPDEALFVRTLNEVGCWAAGGMYPVVWVGVHVLDLAVARGHC